MNDRQMNRFGVDTLGMHAARLGIGTFLIVAMTVAFLAMGTQANAATLFWEDFDGYNYFPDDFPANDPVNFGVPITAEGADNDWYGARFETPDSAITNAGPLEDIYLDLGVQKIPGGGRSSPDPVGRVGDDAGLLFKVDTTNLVTGILAFDWRLFSVSSSDKLVVGYTTLDLDPFFSPFVDNPLNVSAGIATPGGGNVNLIADFLNDPAAGNGSQAQVVSWWANNWTEILRGNDTSWNTESFQIPGGVSELWIAFWIDNGDGDFAKIDNIRFEGTLIPEPSTWLMAVIGAVMTGGVAVGRRRQSAQKGRIVRQRSSHGAQS